MTRALLVVSGVALAACAANPAPVPLHGDAAVVARLAGDWTGEYVGEGTGRAGSIVFRVHEGHAHGDVVMTPRTTGRPLLSYWPVEGQRRLTEVMTIEFVHVSADSIVGRLTPYRDADCDCPVWTAFSGVLRGDSLAGTYSSIRTDATRTTGRWWVARRR
jgi:hypothetical protein